MSEVKVNKISPRTNCGTVTLGDSGDSFVIPAGATITNNGTQTGFGRTGTVNWDTTVKTSNFTSVSGVGYFVNTTGGTITVTLPASPSAGDIVSIADYAGTAATNIITIDRNGSKFESGTVNGAITVNRQTGTFIYVDSTQGWVVVNSNDASFIGPEYIAATGGTITTSGNFKIHTFTGPGTFTVCSVGNSAGSNSVDYLVVAGGGSGGGRYGGGGGAGGYRESSGAASGCYTVSPLGSNVPAQLVSAQGYPITVGGGGAQPATDTPTDACGTAMGTKGSNSVFTIITSTGGGGGAGQGNASAPVQKGGSGGGASYNLLNLACRAGNEPPVSPPQGNPGGNNDTSGGPPYTSGGGGAAGGAGGTSTPTKSGAGGPGVTSSINGTPTTRAGGGGGGGSTHVSPSSGSAGNAGAGGGGVGGSTAGARTCAGTANTGGGGGGGFGNPGMGGAGGSGIVIIRYKFQN